MVRFAARLLVLSVLVVGVIGCGDNLPGGVDADECSPVDDGNDCTDDICVGGVLLHPPRAAGEVCATGVCDGDGTCVGCLDDDDCTTGDQICDEPNHTCVGCLDDDDCTTDDQICDEPNHTCVDPTCKDGEQDGDETDVDCGGSCAPAATCADGLHCAIAADCTSGVCTGTVCQVPACGDGVRQGTEACDDGNQTNGDGCDDGTGGNCRPTGCGNGVVSGTEICDDGNATNGDGCDNNCTMTGCGNGIIAAAETCDDGNAVAGDGCSATCVGEPGFTCTGLPSVCVTMCGDGVRAGLEACDDGGTTSGNGCSATCTVEPGFTCTGSPSVCVTTCGDGVRAGLEACDDGGTAIGDGCSAICTVEPGFTCTGSPSTCTTTCGDGVRAGLEACDDGGTAVGDGCSAICTVEPGFTCTGTTPSVCVTTCGDGIRAGLEACDDGGTTSGNGCSATCTVEPGFTCTGSPSTCVTTCGDGVRAGLEQCDDGGTTSGNGCSATCTTEPGFTCTGSPSTCTTSCGDGIRAGAEQCDDGGTTSGNGCSATCTTEPGFTCTGSPSTCVTTCGDGVRAGLEQCDDGGTTSGNGCSATCTTEPGFTCTGSPSTCTTSCGDGIRAGAEQCDDGGTTSGNGCSATCTTEPGFTCTGSPSTCVTTCGDGVRAGLEQCDDGGTTSGNGCSATCTTELGFTCTGSPSTCITTCGDGIRAGLEQCDDGGTTSGNGCSATCALEPGFLCVGDTPTLCTPICGDGNVVAGEGCDDGGLAPGDGCSAVCTVEPGFTCTGSPSTCSAGCGDGIVTGGEACDDGGNLSGDGCSASCTTEPGFTCTGSPSTCITTCGDGVVAGLEQCDDGGTTGGNGCSATCTTEPGFTCAGSPSTCITTCGDGVVAGLEQCDDGGTTSGNGCSATCTVEQGYTCAGSPSTCTSTCGDGVRASNEGCDDGGTTSGNGCSATCTVEPGFICTGDTPSVCAANCGDGQIVGPEQCDDNNPAGGDGCSATCQIEPGFSCFGTPSVCAIRCGDGVLGGSEQCDDGCGAGVPFVCEPADNNDGCSSTCLIECGNGTLQGTEQCDDGNRNPGDGCSAVCAFEFTCAAGDTLVQLRSTDVPKTIPDNTPAGIDSVVVVPAASQGAIRKALVGFGRIVHTFDGDLTLSLTAPTGRRRDLAAARGLGGDNFVTTRFDDTATTLISAGVAPFTGLFRPDQSLSDPAGFAGQNAAGTWALHAVDAANDDFGSIVGWTLGLCVDPTAVCGNGALNAGETCDDGNLTNGDGCAFNCRAEPGYACTGAPSTCTIVCGDGVVLAPEQCDDGNTGAGDGCSATCTVELTCGAGETTLIIRSADVPKAIPDNLAAGATSVVPIATTGAVRKVIATFGQITHGNDAHLDTFLISPNAITRELSTDNPGTGTGVNFTSTIFNDASATLITAITAAQNPYRGVFRPEQSLTTTPGTDFLNQPAAGNWTLRVADDTSSTVGTLDAWTLAMCVDPTAICGNGVVNTGETCDDGNTTAGDGCGNLCTTEPGYACTGAPSTCTVVCGDGIVIGAEQCDDGFTNPGDGCSPTCTVEITCGAGETPLVVRSTDVPKAIPDNTAAGATSVVPIVAVGAVRKVIATFGQITHGNDAHLDTFLISPLGITRELSTDNPGAGTGVNFTSTIFNDASLALITGITAAQNPYRGVFRPEQSLTTTAGTDFLNQPATGTWTVRVADDTTGTTGTLDSWTLALCVDTGAVCGNGVVDSGEQCDDGNTALGDGCTNACRTELGFTCAGMPSACTMTCGAGETPLFLTNATATAIPDTNGGVISTINVPVAGVVRNVMPIVTITHANVGHLDVFLTPPFGVQRELSTDNGSGTGVNFTATAFNDAATTLITAGTAPYTGPFRPEQSLATAAPGGFGNQTALGGWTLRIADDTTGTTGTLNRWSLAICIDPLVPSVCGNGIVELAETCDDTNATAGDGCDATCQVELNCAVGQTPVLARGGGLPVIIPDNVAAGVTTTATVAAVGTVRKTVLVLGAIGHQFDGDLSFLLTSPAATAVDASSGNGGGGDDFVSTIFDDAATPLITAIVSGGAPFRGRFKPEAATGFTPYNGQAAAGTWSLRVADNAGTDAGLVGAWTLGLCVE